MLKSTARYMAPQRLVIVGGNAGGATCAARISRVRPEINMCMLEHGPDVSYANCGLPYFIGGEIKDKTKLALQTPQSLHTAIGVNVQTCSTVTKIDRTQKIVHYENRKNNTTHQVSYDKLLLSPGASPIFPNVKGIDDARIQTLRNLKDMNRIDAMMKSRGCKRVAILGAGFIGLELVEQLTHIGKHVTLIDRSPTVLPQADADMGSFFHRELECRGVELHLGDGLKQFEPSEKSVGIVLDSGTVVDADVVLLCIGVRPESGLATGCNLEVTKPRGCIVVNEAMQTSDPDIYAVGDVVETNDFVFPEKKAWMPLGNLANIQARIAADHIAFGKTVGYQGSFGTAIVRSFNMALGVTGWSEARLQREGIPFQKAVITNLAHAGYYPNAKPITIKIIFEPNGGRVIGGQVFGAQGVDKRTDDIAMAILGKRTVCELAQAQLTYAPPFGSARDPINVCGLIGRNIVDGFLDPMFRLPTKEDNVVILDVRGEPWAQKISLRDAPGNPFDGIDIVRIPFTELKGRINELDKSKTYVTICNWGRASYFAHRDLATRGFKSKSLVGGVKLHLKELPAEDPEDPSTPPCVKARL